MTAHGAQTALRDISACIGFYTRLPAPYTEESGRAFAASQWAAPLAGAVVGLAVGGVAWLSTALGVPAMLAAAAAFGAGIALTGALHEDGLADLADGFGGGKDREAKLAIMRDSRLGSYGALALVMSVLARWAALTALISLSAPTLFLAVIAAHASSRAMIPMLMSRLPSARTDGLAASIGRVEPRTAMTAVTIGGIALLTCGFWFAVTAAVIILCVSLFVERLARNQIGGHTGDVLGTLQQGCELAVLATAATLLVAN